MLFVISDVAGVVGIEDTIYEIKARGYFYQELSVFSELFKIVFSCLSFYIGVM